MKNFKLIFTLCLLLSTLSSFAADPISQQLKKEFFALHEKVSKLKPDFVVGGYLNGKIYGDHEMLWHLAEEQGQPDVIRIYRDKGEEKDALDISFHRSSAIVRDRTVIRRFVGPAMRGWRNDTMDVNTGEYLGSQGSPEPELDERDLAIMEQWGLKLFQ